MRHVPKRLPGATCGASVTFAEALGRSQSTCARNSSARDTLTAVSMHRVTAPPARAH